MPGSAKIGKIEIGADVLAALRGGHEQPPSGWMSVRQVGDTLQCTTVHAGRLLAALAEAGRLERRMFIKGKSKMWFYDVTALKK